MGMLLVLDVPNIFELSFKLHPRLYLNDYELLNSSHELFSGKVW